MCGPVTGRAGCTVASAGVGERCPGNSQGHVYKHTLAGVHTCQHCGKQRIFDVMTKEWK